MKYTLSVLGLGFKFGFRFEGLNCFVAKYLDEYILKYVHTCIHTIGSWVYCFGFRV